MSGIQNPDPVPPTSTENPLPPQTRRTRSSSMGSEDENPTGNQEAARPTQRRGTKRAVIKREEQEDRYDSYRSFRGYINPMKEFIQTNNDYRRKTLALNDALMGYLLNMENTINKLEEN